MSEPTNPDDVPDDLKRVGERFQREELGGGIESYLDGFESAGEIELSCSFTDPTGPVEFEIPTDGAIAWLDALVASGEAGDVRLEFPDQWRTTLEFRAYVSRTADGYSFRITGEVKTVDVDEK